MEMTPEEVAEEVAAGRMTTDQVGDLMAAKLLEAFGSPSKVVSILHDLNLENEQLRKLLDKAAGIARQQDQMLKEQHLTFVKLHKALDRIASGEPGAAVIARETLINNALDHIGR